jgi:hypothetical protein
VEIFVVITKRRPRNKNIMPSLGLALNQNFLRKSAGVIVPPFVPPMDELVSQGATCLYAASQYRLVTSYTGPIAKLQGNGTGSPEADIGYASNGRIDLAAASAIATQDGGNEAFGVTWYGQLGGRNATQSSAASRMPFSTVMNAKGGWGNGVAQSGVGFNLNLGALVLPVFFSIVVKYQLEISGTRFIIGESSSSSTRYLRIASGAMQSNWGTSLNGNLGELLSNVYALGFLANGASSKHYRNETLLTTGNAGNTQLAMSNGRLGRGLANSTVYLAGAGNAILEVIVFNMDPTSLPGWSAFVTNQLARFA